MYLTYWIGVEEKHWSMQNTVKHSVVKNTRGIHTNTTEKDNFSKVQNNASDNRTGKNGYSLISGKQTGGAIDDHSSFIPQQTGGAIDDRSSFIR